MVREKIMIESALGVHLRPARAMCDAAIKYKSHIYFEFGEGKTANAKSVLSILASTVKCGEEIILVAEGEDEASAIKEVSEKFRASLMDS